ncbi:hypothetical protein BgAZ_203850 [Babesia gibsoni]|uniref:C2H2-type domain-containing protein n=1 Tax=Babesia gibsoni TaxID=33632 RepID=A0AAD8PDW8_BABGI|nr:hypothetical protein BgAZ_203850 [Babesia gibsoni]
MWEYQREECSELRFKLGSSVFCHCGTPFVDRHRTVPCYHVLCSTCVLAVKQNNICVLCHGECQETQPIHPNEDLYVCTVQACNKGFLNFPSLRIHAKASHSIETHSIVDFYSKNGDTAVQLGEVHKIAQEHQMTDFDKEEFE